MQTTSRMTFAAKGFLFLFVFALGGAAPGASGAVHARFDLATPAGGPFPSDRFTVPDPSHNTGRRVNLPKPDCATRPSDCADLDVINTLDGFNLQPRLSIPFDGPIDVATVTSKTVFLISLGSTLPPGDGDGKFVGINQVVWDPASNTLYAESDEFLDQHTRYGLIVTRGVRDPSGAPVQASEAFQRFIREIRFLRDPDLADYREVLGDALWQARRAGVPQADVVVASVFTTQSATAILEKIRDQIKARSTAPADFCLGPGGTRTLFPLSTVTGITFNRQIGTAPSFQAVALPIDRLRIFPGAVGQIAFGKYLSPDYQTPQKFIPPVGTHELLVDRFPRPPGRLGERPIVQRTNEIFFNLFLPSGPRPASGWPVAIYGHGGGDSKDGGPLSVAATMAAHGIATIAINVVGHGFGPRGTVTVNRAAEAPVSFLSGGRGIDQDGDGLIGSQEGYLAAPPQTIIFARDALRQTVVDLMQLVRVIEVGMDADGDGSRDLDPSRIYYFGLSFGGFYGTMLLAVEPRVRVGVPNVPGGSHFETWRIGVLRPRVGSLLASRIPSLINVGGILFNENLPLRNQPPVINTVPGALAIQEVIENTEWVSQSGNPVAYAPYLRKAPLAGVPAKSVIYQFAKGDQTNPNPTTTAILRAGDLADRATFFRNDRAFAENPAVPKNPHVFLTQVAVPAVAAIALGAQQQIAVFFASDGTRIIHPEPRRFFEVPIALPLPEDLAFIP